MCRRFDPGSAHPPAQAPIFSGLADFMNITPESDPLSSDAQVIGQTLLHYNLQHVPFFDRKPLILLLRDDNGQVVGGLRGNTGWHWLYVEALAIADHVRGQRWGTQLLAAAEREAAARGCHSAYLDTFDFQALPFYQKQGYTLFGTLDGFAGEHKRYFLQKRFA
jgi:GNAT superfamily N-acetyltransferase